MKIESEFKIDTNVPAPEDRRGYTRYPFPQMEVGHSFFAPISTARLKNASFSWGKKNSRTFSVRTVTEGGVKGCRVWRIA